MENILKLSEYIDNLHQRGWYVFTKKDMAKQLPLSPQALAIALYRQEQKGRIHRVKNDFYVIVPLEYRALGTIPGEWFLGELMRYQGISYYVGLLSAAAYHGASHQASQTLQVIVSRKIRDITIGRLKIEFIQKKGISDAAVNNLQTPMGVVYFASPEQTAFDVMQFLPKCGHLDHVATIMSELTEKLSASKLQTLIPYQETATIQRLGYLFETLDREDLAKPLKQYLNSIKHPYAALRPDIPKTGYPISRDWHLYINHTFDSDDL